jgi:hypothetical protein
MLESMPVLDVSRLEAVKIDELAAYDRICEEPFLPFPRMVHVPARRQIDEVLAHTIRLPDLTVLRELLAREPVVTEIRISVKRNFASIVIISDHHSYPVPIGCRQTVVKNPE